MQHQTHLIGESRTATGAVGGKLALVQLDQVLSLATCAVEAVVEPFGATVRQAGHDVTDVETLRGRLDPRGDASIDSPRLRAVARLGVAADRCRIFLGAAHPHIVGDGLDQAAEHVIAREAEHEVDAIFLAEIHYLGTGIVAVTANGDMGVWPVAPDRPHQASQVAAYLLP